MMRQKCTNCRDSKGRTTKEHKLNKTSRNAKVNFKDMQKGQCKKGKVVLRKGSNVKSGCWLLGWENQKFKKRKNYETKE